MEDESKTRVLETPTPGPPVRASIVSNQRMGRRIGQYELVRRIAHGGMATVYLGRQTGTAGFEKVVALKLIHPHLADEPEFLGMFLDEARIAARLHHPHVVEILNLGADGDTHYMVMEFVEGGTLSALVRAHPGPLPLAVSLQILADCLDGLAAAHELKDRDGEPYDLVHRDVSPQNLLVSMDGHVKVTDFGIMKAAGRHGRTRTGELRGKVAYMSPEHASENRTDPRSDIFAVGVIGWELVAGRRLFAEENDAATLKRVIACDVRALPDSCFEGASEATAAAVRQLLDRSMQPNPDRRFSSAREMLSAVREALSQDGTVDAREQLSAMMKTHFTDRAEYLRAALRDRGDSDSIEVQHGSPRLAVVVDDETPNDAGGSVTTTVTTSAGKGPRSWLPWIALPLAGAAIAVGVMRFGQPDEPAAVAPTEIVAATEPEPEAPPPPAAETPAEIHWYISTDPEGATLTVDGVDHPKPTPTEVVVRRGPPVTLILNKDGMRPTKAVLRPMSDDNLFYRLVPESQPPTADPATTIRQSPRVKPKVKKPKSVGTASDSGENTGDSGPGFKPMPNFGDDAKTKTD